MLHKTNCSFCFSLYRTASPFLNLTTVLRTEYRWFTTKQSDVWQNVWTFKISLSLINYLSEQVSGIPFQERFATYCNLQRTNTGHFKKYNLCIYRIYTTVNTFLFFNMIKGGCNIGQKYCTGQKCTKAWYCSLWTLFYTKCFTFLFGYFLGCIFLLKVNFKDLKPHIMLWLSREFLGRATQRPSSHDWTGSCRRQLWTISDIKRQTKCISVRIRMQDIY